MANNNYAIAEPTMNDISGAGVEPTGFNINTDNGNNTEYSEYADTKSDTMVDNSNTTNDIFDVEALIDAASKTLTENIDESGNIDWEAVVEEFSNLYRSRIEGIKATTLEDSGQKDDLVKNYSTDSPEPDNTSDMNSGGEENKNSHDEAPPMDMKMSEYGTEMEDSVESQVSDDVNMTSKPDSMEQSTEDTTVEISSTGAEPIENPNIPADTNDGDDIAKLDFSTQYTDPNGVGTRTYTGTNGANTFQAEALLNAKPEIIAKHVDNDGKINWQGVAGENDNRHDHWVEGPGEITIDNFGEGDKFILRGHTAEAILLEEADGVATVGLISDQGRDNSRGNGAHDLDVLGKATIHHDGSFNFGEDVTDITEGVFDGVSEFA